MGHHLPDFFDGDWLVILPKTGRSRIKASLTRLGFIALLGSKSLPEGLRPGPDEEFYDHWWRASCLLCDLSPIENPWSFISTLKVLPHVELERASAEFSGDRFSFFLFSMQQRARFGEEAVKVWKDGGGSAKVFWNHEKAWVIRDEKLDRLVINYLSRTPPIPESSEPNDHVKQR